MQVNLNVRRYNPEKPDGAYWQSYRLDVPDHFTVLDALIQVREEVDGSLALRCSCRSAICGSCAMRINGQAELACKTKVAGLLAEGEEIRVEPQGNTSVVKDLVVDLKPFWDKIRAVEPWLRPSGPPPEREHVVPNEAMAHLAGVMGCIMCGACVSDCPALETGLAMGRSMEDSFLGPAALAKAYRFVADPRDAGDEERLRRLSDRNGVWDCTRCNICVEVCPKDVAPMERILALRRRAIEAGEQAVLGAKQTLEFEKFVRETSWLKE
jgi:succinate dehydrogenase / fumarate reductase iron-sulfur subunit